MVGLIRLFIRALSGHARSQVLLGIFLAAFGVGTFIVAQSNSTYSQWTAVGVVFAVLGSIFLILGIIKLLQPKPVVRKTVKQQTSYTGVSQYPPQ